jgi:hypothetical protein
MSYLEHLIHRDRYLIVTSDGQLYFSSDLIKWKELAGYVGLAVVSSVTTLALAKLYKRLQQPDSPRLSFARLTSRNSGQPSSRRTTPTTRWPSLQELASKDMQLSRKAWMRVYGMQWPTGQ